MPSSSGSPAAEGPGSAAAASKGRAPSNPGSNSTGRGPLPRACLRRASIPDRSSPGAEEVKAPGRAAGVGLDEAGLGVGVVVGVGDPDWSGKGVTGAPPGVGGAPGVSVVGGALAGSGTGAGSSPGGVGLGTVLEVSGSGGTWAPAPPMPRPKTPSVIANERTKSRSERGVTGLFISKAFSPKTASSPL